MKKDRHVQQKIGEHLSFCTTRCKKGRHFLPVHVSESRWIVPWLGVKQSMMIVMKIRTVSKQSCTENSWYYQYLYCKSEDAVLQLEKPFSSFQSFREIKYLNCSNQECNVHTPPKPNKAIKRLSEAADRPSIDGKNSGKAPWEVITTVSFNSLQHPHTHPNPEGE